MKLQISIFDDQQKSFWNKGSKLATKDIFELFKMKKKSLKKQQYTIDSQFVFGKVVKGQIDKQFPLVTTTFILKTREEIQQQTTTNGDIAYGYEFRRKGKSKLLYASENTHTNLIDILNRVCIRTDFHQTYVCQKLVNSGKFGMVFVGKNRNTEQLFAIKSFKKDYLKESNQFLQGLVNEITVNRQLLSEGLLPLIETFETDSSVYLIYEYTNGGQLLDRFKLQSGPKLNSYIVQAIMERLVRTISYLHSKGFMHRDLNPDNIIYRNQNDHSDVLIADMGFIDQIQKPSLIYKRCGNPGYVAPEILAYRVGSPYYDEKCDVFSLGTILFVLLTGTKPFSGASREETIKLNIQCEIDYKHPVLKNRPEATIDLLQKLLAKDPKDRPSANQVTQN